jgi:hypothetical protein
MWGTGGCEAVRLRGAYFMKAAKLKRLSIAETLNAKIIIAHAEMNSYNGRAVCMLTENGK